jgi:hypothetical protein
MGGGYNKDRKAENAYEILMGKPGGKVKLQDRGMDGKEA